MIYLSNDWSEYSLDCRKALTILARYKLFIFYSKGEQTVIEQTKNILGFVSHMVFVKITRRCHGNKQAAIDSM